MPKYYKSSINSEYYDANWIDKKIKKVINKHRKDGDSYFHFKNVLSKAAVERSTNNYPRSLSQLDAGRKFSKDENIKFTNDLRKQPVHFIIKPEEVVSSDDGKQRMSFGEFYLRVAKFSGIENPRLSQSDKALVHDPELMVL
jgi:hypothetical protein